MSVPAFAPAKPVNLPLLIGLTSGTGGGKTFSALRVAKGIAGDRPFAAIDTEMRRMSHYARYFRFDVMDLEPPFRPERFLEAVQAAEKAGYPCVVVDSMSHEWNGTGGVVEWHDEEVDRMSKGATSFAEREKYNFPAWQKPKLGHRAMLDGLLQVRIPVIYCFRGKKPAKMAKDEKGRNTVIEGEFQAITSDDIPYEMTCLLVLNNRKPGTIDLEAANKISEPVRHLVRDGVQLDEAFGAAMAAWARGDDLQEKPREASPFAVTDRKGTVRRADTVATWAQGWHEAIAACQKAGKLEDLQKLRASNQVHFDALRAEHGEAVAEIEALIRTVLGEPEQQDAAA